ncbi:hypothetical protein AMAG_15792 [Allomyces macrogynus ATCC 38327]|uniref:Uncharacterized protein n=1 Tax=Allomyces macrogynus (strain ATCC 38327) TaxID=578462 RepID=A0A0L0T8T9_ALLM3|nr:hypothetical protein AMAG_15792 [Allomyces macrogynus ATCC 38327]|eukprot:KNE71121.1 hypothetical protein AMAG_15792 [Allomyces macrogynus ATCC 38327]
MTLDDVAMDANRQPPLVGGAPKATAANKDSSSMSAALRNEKASAGSTPAAAGSSPGAPAPPTKKPPRKRKKWTPEEEGALLGGVRKYGVGAWSIILSDREFVFDSHRTAVDLKDKWRVMTNRRAAASAAAPATPSTSSTHAEARGRTTSATTSRPRSASSKRRRDSDASPTRATIPVAVPMPTIPSSSPPRPRPSRSPPRARASFAPSPPNSALKHLWDPTLDLMRPFPPLTMSGYGTPLLLRPSDPMPRLFDSELAMVVSASTARSPTVLATNANAAPMPSSSSSVAPPAPPSTASISSVPRSSLSSAISAAGGSAGSAPMWSFPAAVASPTLPSPVSLTSGRSSMSSMSLGTPPHAPSLAIPPTAAMAPATACLPAPVTTAPAPTTTLLPASAPPVVAAATTFLPAPPATPFLPAPDPPASAPAPAPVTLLSPGFVPPAPEPLHHRPTPIVVAPLPTLSTETMPSATVFSPTVNELADLIRSPPPTSMVAPLSEAELLTTDAASTDPDVLGQQLLDALLHADAMRSTLCTNRDHFIRQFVESQKQLVEYLFGPLKPPHPATAPAPAPDASAASGADKPLRRDGPGSKDAGCNKFAPADFFNTLNHPAVETNPILSEKLQKAMDDRKNTFRRVYRAVAADNGYTPPPGSPPPPADASGAASPSPAADARDAPLHSLFTDADAVDLADLLDAALQLDDATRTRAVAVLASRPFTLAMPKIRQWAFRSKLLQMHHLEPTKQQRPRSLVRFGFEVGAPRPLDPVDGEERVKGPHGAWERLLEMRRAVDLARISPPTAAAAAAAAAQGAGGGSAAGQPGKRTSSNPLM